MNRLMAKINPVGRGQQHTTPSAVGTPALKTGGAATGQHGGKDGATGGVAPSSGRRRHQNYCDDEVWC